MSDLSEKLEGLAVVAGLHDQLRRAQERITALEAKVLQWHGIYADYARAAVAERTEWQDRVSVLEQERDEARIQAGKYKQALHELVQLCIQIENDPSTSPTAKARQDELGSLRKELSEERGRLAEALSGLLMRIALNAPDRISVQDAECVAARAALKAARKP